MGGAEGRRGPPRRERRAAGPGQWARGACHSSAAALRAGRCGLEVAWLAGTADSLRAASAAPAGLALAAGEQSTPG